MKVTRAKASGSLKWDGGRLFVREGQTIDPDHPVVARYPQIFEVAEFTPDIPVPGEIRDKKAPRDEPPVERGTRAPGEVRTGRLRTVKP